MKKKVALIVLIVALTASGYLGITLLDSGTPQATAAKKTYSATVYIAGMGGHFAKADVVIDPNNSDNPIKLDALDKIDIGTKETHPTHDARIDVNDRNTMFWSTYVLDPNGKMHVGKSDLKTGNVIKDIALDPDPRAKGQKPLYCASGQTKENFIPVYMGSEGFIDVFDKKDLTHKHRLFISDIGYKDPNSYIYVHGINSNNMKTFIVAINQKGDDGKANGKVDFVLVDLPSLEQGKWKVLAKNTLTGEPRKTLTFRQYFSTDDKLIYQSAGDRLWVLDASTLKLVDEKMTPGGGEIHDAMPTIDGKYALLTVRTMADACDIEGKPIAGKSVMDGVLMLYDADTKKIMPKSTSTCLECHKGMGLGEKTATLCGLDANWK